MHSELLPVRKEPKPLNLESEEPTPLSSSSSDKDSQGSEEEEEEDDGEDRLSRPLQVYFNKRDINTIKNRQQQDTFK